MIDRFKKILVAFWPPVLFGLVVSNFALSCSAYRSASPREFHYYREITNNIPVVSSCSSVSSIPSNSPPVDVSTSVDVRQPSEVSLPYTFMIVGGAPCIRFYGRYYYEGDVMSRGRIFRIFPDRVFLQTGDVICNSSVPVDRDSSPRRSRSSSSKLPQFQRMFNK